MKDFKTMSKEEFVSDMKEDFITHGADLTICNAIEKIFFSDLGEDFIFKDLESDSINKKISEKSKNPKLIQKLIDSGKSEMAIDNIVLVELNNITSFMYAVGIRPGRLFKVTKVSTYKHQGKQKYNYTIYIPEIKQTITVKPHFIKEVEI